MGFGTWHIVPNGRATRAVLNALDAGYRLIDTAKIYGNEKGVGDAIRQSTVSRDDIFVTTKLFNGDQGYKSALKAFEVSMRLLGLDYLDLYLLHWPVTGKRLESWRALEEISASGRAKQIGVSNFTIKHLKELFAASSIRPAVNQIEFHPFMYEDQRPVLEFCQKEGIVVEAYSPLARGTMFKDNATLTSLAKAYGKSNAQIILRWCVQHGTVPIPSSTTPEHLHDNLDIFDFALSAKDMQAVDALSNGTRTCWNPDDIE